MSYAKAFLGTAARAAVLVAGGLTLTACDTLSALNPFGGEKYKMEIVPEVAAPKLYDEALGRMKSGDYEGAAKKFTQIDKQQSKTEWGRKALIMSAYANYEGKVWEEAINDSKRAARAVTASFAASS